MDCNALLLEQRLAITCQSRDRIDSSQTVYIIRALYKTIFLAMLV